MVQLYPYTRIPTFVYHLSMYLYICRGRNLCVKVSHYILLTYFRRHGYRDICITHRHVLYISFIYYAYLFLKYTTYSSIFLIKLENENVIKYVYVQLEIISILKLIVFFEIQFKEIKLWQVWEIHDFPTNSAYFSSISSKKSIRLEKTHHFWDFTCLSIKLPGWDNSQRNEQSQKSYGKIRNSLSFTHWKLIWLMSLG
jgi:hypothetical protein